MKKFLNIKGSLMDLSTPLVMGIINITPDSFFSGSRKNSEKEILERASQILEEGGTIIDLGGQLFFS
jgi:dihydropteroate synthase